MHTRFLMILPLAGALMGAGCREKTPTPGAAAPGDPGIESAHAPSLQAPARQAPAAAGGLRFSAPEGWKAETPSSPNRQAQYSLARVPGDPEDAEAVVYHFEGGGGTPQANIERWIGQFRKPDGSPASDTARIANRTINGIPVTVVDVSGSYTGSMMAMQGAAGPKPGFRMLGAIAETGNGLWFVKLTGPAPTVASWQPGFEAFLDSLAPAP